MGSIRKMIEDGLESAKKRFSGKAPALAQAATTTKALEAADKLGGYTKQLGVDNIKKNVAEKQKVLKELE